MGDRDSGTQRRRGDESTGSKVEFMDDKHLNEQTAKEKKDRHSNGQASQQNTSFPVTGATVRL